MSPTTFPIYLKSIKVYLWIFTIFGLQLPPPFYSATGNSPKKHFIFSIYAVYCAVLVALAIYTAHEHNVVVHISTMKYQLDGITTITSYLQNVALVVVHGTMEMRTMRKHKDLQEIFQLIELLEDEILVQGCRKRRRCIKCQLLRVSGLCLLALIVTLIGLNYYLIGGAMSTPIKVILLFFIVAMQIKCVEYGLYIQLTYEFIDGLCDSLRALKDDIDKFPRRRGEALPWPLLKQLMRCQQLLNRVWSLVRRIERYFAGPVFLVFYFNAMAILFTVNWTYMRYLYESKDIYQTFRLVYILVLLMNLLLVCCLTEKCMKRYQSIASLLHNFKLHSQDSNMLMRLREFSMQLMHQKLRFTCSEYLDVDFPSFGKMLLAISGYAIILVQFKMEDKSAGAVLATELIFGKKT